MKNRTFYVEMPYSLVEVPHLLLVGFMLGLLSDVEDKVDMFVPNIGQLVPKLHVVITEKILNN
jgi:hypothetical protein